VAVVLIDIVEEEGLTLHPVRFQTVRPANPRRCSWLNHTLGCLSWHDSNQQRGPPKIKLTDSKPNVQ
jgi:hypothetical protein